MSIHRGLWPPTTPLSAFILFVVVPNKCYNATIILTHPSCSNGYLLVWRLLASCWSTRMLPCSPGLRIEVANNESSFCTSSSASSIGTMCCADPESRSLSPFIIPKTRLSAPQTRRRLRRLLLFLIRNTPMPLPGRPAFL
eukprot:g50031.t1